MDLFQENSLSIDFNSVHLWWEIYSQINKCDLVCNALIGFCVRSVAVVWQFCIVPNACPQFVTMKSLYTFHYWIINTFSNQNGFVIYNAKLLKKLFGRVNNLIPLGIHRAITFRIRTKFPYKMTFMIKNFMLSAIFR